MDRRDYKSLRQDRNRNTRENQNPSFSSTLLDAIYRSIDENNGEEREEELIFYRETMRKKQSHSNNNNNNNNNANCSLKENQLDLANLKRACLIEKWMMEKKKTSEKLVVRRKSMADFDRYSRNGMLLNSSSSSSDSSNFSGGLSSSDAEFIYGGGVNSNCRPKPIRTSVSTRQQPQQQKKSENARNYNIYHTDDNQIQWRKSEHESNFVKTKSRALKIYSDLKKIKQPISPGGRLTSFLNSLFTPGNSKKSKSSAAASTTTTTTCSSASSFSRSCLSKTPSSIGKLSSNGTKRSVSFYPVSVIVDEDCRPCGQKSLQKEDHDQFGLIAVKNVRKSVSDRNRRVEENVRDHVMLKRYQRNGDLDMKAVNEASDDEDDDDDAASCSSSDLFELDNLGSIGIDRYREELPVYETTHFDTNRAIAKGLFV